MRPMFTVHAGEYLVADCIEQRIGKSHGLRVWVPSKDDGIDLLVTSKDCRKTASIQVKFSKSYTNGKDCDSSGWWAIDRDKLRESKADYWVFVMPELNEDWKFEDCCFIIIPPNVLLRRLLAIFKEGSKKFDVYFTRKNNVVVQTRGVRKRDRIRLLETPEHARDFSNYLNNWDEMLKKLR